MLTQEKPEVVFLFWFPFYRFNSLSNSSFFHFLLCKVLAGLSWALPTMYTFFWSLWKSDLKTRGFIVLEAKPVLQGQTKIRKEVFGWQTAIKCFSCPVQVYLGMFFQNSRFKQENHSYLELGLWELFVTSAAFIGRKSRLRWGLPEDGERERGRERLSGT